MSRVRRWTPGREYTTAIEGVSWFRETADTLIAVAVLHGSVGTNRPEIVAAHGPWGQDVDQLWIVAIPKAAQHPFQAEGHVLVYDWCFSRDALYDKPHRAIRDGFDDGIVISRTPVGEIPGVRLLDRLGVVRYETRRDERAVRLWQAARLRSEKRAQAARRRWRNYRDAETWRGQAYKGRTRKDFGWRR